VAKSRRRRFLRARESKPAIYSGASKKDEALSMPHLRPMPVIGPRCHELRIQDAETGSTWRIVYRADVDEIVVVDVFAKKTKATPKQAIERCKQRLRDWDRDD
jgi:phage-related protein